MIASRHPLVARQVVAQFGVHEGTSEALRAVVVCKAQLEEAGFEMPSWDALVAGARPQSPDDELLEKESGIFEHGWQFYAARALDNRCRASPLRNLTRPEQAHLRSQSGPGAGAAFVTVPSRKECRIEPQAFRILLRRRLRLDLQLAPGRCRCHQFLDSEGDHRTACPTAGVLATRGCPLESAAARVCREGGPESARACFCGT